MYRLNSDLNSFPPNLFFSTNFYNTLTGFDGYIQYTDNQIIVDCNSKNKKGYGKSIFALPYPVQVMKVRYYAFVISVERDTTLNPII